MPEEENLHLYLDPLEDLINPPNRSASPSCSSDEEPQEKMLISPISNSTPCKKQTTITGKKWNMIFEQLFRK